MGIRTNMRWQGYRRGCVISSFATADSQLVSTCPSRKFDHALHFKQHNPDPPLSDAKTASTDCRTVALSEHCAQFALYPLQAPAEQRLCSHPPLVLCWPLATVCRQTVLPAVPGHATCERIRNTRLVNWWTGCSRVPAAFQASPPLLPLLDQIRSAASDVRCTAVITKVLADDVPFSVFNSPVKQRGVTAAKCSMRNRPPSWSPEKTDSPSGVKPGPPRGAGRPRPPRKETVPGLLAHPVGGMEETPPNSVDGKRRIHSRDPSSPTP